MYLKAYAKINLSLNVVGVRKDGYHELDMINLPLELHDTIAVSRINKKLEPRILINDAPTEFSNNFCLNLILDLMKRYNIKKKYEFAIYKEIPMQSGLGGGSSNAAEIFNFYNKKMKLKIPSTIAINLVQQFGCDIPFFLLNKPARVRGTGEVVEPINVKNDYYVLIVKPKQGLSTKEVYKALGKKVVTPANIDCVIKALENGDDDLLVKSIGNALEEPAIKMCPKIEEIKNYLIKNGLQITLMTGSGTAVFSLSRDKAKIEDIAAKLKKLNYNVISTKIKRR